MTRSQRAVHAWGWLMLTPLLIAAVIAGSMGRRPPPTQPAIIPAPTISGPFMGPDFPDHRR